MARLGAIRTLVCIIFVTSNVNHKDSDLHPPFLVLHQYFLSYFGLHIGELWDLKALAEHCKAIGRYTFLLTSVPLHVSGLVGSPPNALALF